MRKLLGKIHSFINQSAYLFLTDYENKEKKYILSQFIKFNLLFPFYKNKSSIKFKEFTLYWFNFEYIFWLFKEIFVKWEYKFETDNNYPIIIDLGTNIGISVIYMKYLYPNAVIYWFEPDKKTFNYLEKNILNNNLKNVNYYNYAVSDYDWEINFFTDDIPSYSMSIKEWRNTNQKSKKIKIKCLSLANFINNNIKNKKINFMKMDVEGAEDLIFNDLNKNNLLKNIDQIAIEYHHNIDWEKSNLDKFLNILVENWFTYQIESILMPNNKKNTFQDILIRAYKL